MFQFVETLLQRFELRFEGLSVLLYGLAAHAGGARGGCSHHCQAIR